MNRELDGLMTEADRAALNSTPIKQVELDPYWEFPVMKEESDVVEWFNQRFSSVMYMGKHCVFQHDRHNTGLCGVNTAGKNMQINEAMMLKSEFLSTRGGLKMFVNGKNGPVAYPAAKIWLESNENNHFNSTVFDPTAGNRKSILTPGRGCNSQEPLNLWYGLNPAPAEKSEMTPALKAYLSHIREVLCSKGDAKSREDQYNYFIKHMGFILKYPHILPKVAVVMSGDTRIGKSMALMPFINLLGSQQAAEFKDIHSVSDKFNSALYGKKMIVFNEVGGWAGKMETQGSMKSFITEPTIMYEAKGKDKVSGDNYGAFFILTNEKFAAALGGHGGSEERYFVMTPMGKNEMTPQQIKNRDLFIDTYKKSADDQEKQQYELANLAAYFIENAPETPINLQSIRPNTITQAEQTDLTEASRSAGFTSFFMSLATGSSDRLITRYKGGHEVKTDDGGFATWEYPTYADVGSIMFRPKDRDHNDARSSRDALRLCKADLRGSLNKTLTRRKFTGDQFGKEFGDWFDKDIYTAAFDNNALPVVELWIFAALRKRTNDEDFEAEYNMKVAEIEDALPYADCKRLLESGEYFAKEQSEVEAPKQPKKWEF